jgi:hypothetical protein
MAGFFGDFQKTLFSRTASLIVKARVADKPGINARIADNWPFPARLGVTAASADSIDQFSGVRLESPQEFSLVLGVHGVCPSVHKMPSH